MLEEEHKEICQADIEEAKFLKSAQQLLKELKEEQKKEGQHIKSVHNAMQKEKLESHMVHRLMFIKGKGYEPVPIPQYERQ